MSLINSAIQPSIHGIDLIKKGYDMKIPKNFLMGILLLISLNAYNVCAMEMADTLQDQSQTVTSGSLSIVPETLTTTLQNLKNQLMMSAFILMRIEVVDSEDIYWLPEPPLGIGIQELQGITDQFCWQRALERRDMRECIKGAFAGSDEETSDHESDDVSYHPDFLPCTTCIAPLLNEAGFTDLYFVKRLVRHLDSLHSPLIEDMSWLSSNELADADKQMLMGIAYEIYGTLYSIWPPMLDDTKQELLSTLAHHYNRQKSFVNLNISWQNLQTVLEINKALLLDMIEFRFFVNPPSAEGKHGKRLVQGYIQREKFLKHYLQAYCCYLESDITFSILKWFREESQKHSPPEIYNFIFTCFQAHEESSEEGVGL